MAQVSNTGLITRDQLLHPHREFAARWCRIGKGRKNFLREIGHGAHNGKSIEVQSGVHGPSDLVHRIQWVDLHKFIRASDE